MLLKAEGECAALSIVNKVPVVEVVGAVFRAFAKPDPVGCEVALCRRISGHEKKC